MSPAVSQAAVAGCRRLLPRSPAVPAVPGLLSVFLNAVLGRRCAPAAAWSPVGVYKGPGGPHHAAGSAPCGHAALLVPSSHGSTNSATNQPIRPLLGCPNSVLVPSPLFGLMDASAPHAIRSVLTPSVASVVKKGFVGIPQGSKDYCLRTPRPPLPYPPHRLSPVFPCVLPLLLAAGVCPSCAYYSHQLILAVKRACAGRRPARAAIAVLTRVR